LLGIGLESDDKVNDNTIEAGIRLISKLGITLEARFNEIKDIERNDKQREFYDSVFDRLKELETLVPESPKNRASPRMKILI
jgi:hypothetical protein